MKLFFALLITCASILLLYSFLNQNDESKALPVDQEVIDSLMQLKSEKKFVEEVAIFYPGAPNENARLAAQNIIDSAISRLIDKSDARLTEEEFWKVLERAAIQLQTLDSEEVERGLTYMESMMDIYGIESSYGRLNNWRYGFDPSSRH